MRKKSWRHVLLEKNKISIFEISFCFCLVKSLIVSMRFHAPLGSRASHYNEARSAELQLKWYHCTQFSASAGPRPTWATSSKQAKKSRPGPAPTWATQVSKLKTVDLGQLRPGPLKQARRKRSTWATVKLGKKIIRKKYVRSQVKPVQRSLVAPCKLHNKVKNKIL